jgi:FAD/FMN-containing dehydrogenase
MQPVQRTAVLCSQTQGGRNRAAKKLIGCGKIDLLIAGHGEAVSLMHVIKNALDPDNVINPGKILRI